ncbi:MAG: hypothetical protein IJ552_11525 [Prevotella sp.]|nr:hypothetical protein [Prevotella sp.]
MSTISNRFMAQAIDDGTTLHGELRSTKPLSQAYGGGAAIPSWGAVNSQYPNSPIIFLSLMEGTSLVQPKANSIGWAYNGQSLTFGSSSTTKSIKNGDSYVNYSGYVSTDGKFFKFEYPVPVPGGGGTTVNEPAIAVIGDLASSQNLNVDDIMLTGKYQIGDAEIDFSARAEVRITEIAANGFFGQANFVGGVSDITERGQVITAYGILYTQDGEPVNGVTTRWYLNDSTTPVAGAAITVGGVTYQNAFQVNESDVVDFATVKCEFVKEGAVVYTVLEGIDDRQDPEYLYTQVNNANGNAVSLHKGESTTFTFFVGRTDDPTPLSGWTFKTKLYKGDGTEVTASISGIPNVSDGYRPLTVTDNKASLTVAYEAVVSYFSKRLSGIIYASAS